jgi:hypothetical protein
MRRKARARAERSSGWVRLRGGRSRRSDWIDICEERLHVLSYKMLTCKDMVSRTALITGKKNLEAVRTAMAANI